MNADNLPDRKSPLCPISTAMRRYVLSSTPGLDEGEPLFFSTRREKEKQYSFQFLLPSILLYGTPDEVNSSCRSSGRDIIVPRNGGKLSTVHTILRQRERKFPDAQNRGALEYLAKRRETETASERNSSSLPTEFAIIASEKSCGRESSSIVVVFVLDVADYQLYGVIWNLGEVEIEITSQLIRYVCTPYMYARLTPVCTTYMCWNHRLSHSLYPFADSEKKTLQH